MAAPSFPTSLTQPLVAMSWTEIVQDLRTSNRADPGSVADGLERALMYLDGLATQLGTLLSYLLQVANSAGTVSIQEVDAVAATTTTINPTIAPIAGVLLFVFITPAATTSLIAWGSQFKFASVDYDNTPGTTSIFPFVGRTVAGTTSWYCFALPMTGQS